MPAGGIIDLGINVLIVAIGVGCCLGIVSESDPLDVIGVNRHCKVHKLFSDGFRDLVVYDERASPKLFGLN